MSKLNGKLPTYRVHRNSGQAIVTIGGHDHYLGSHGSAESQAAYDRLISEWLGQGRQLVQPSAQSLPNADEQSGGQTMNHLIHGFWQHAKAYYRKPDGTSTTELDNFRQALRPLRRLYGPSPADQFGPKSLKALREHMISLGWCRSNVNKQISCIKSVFRWAVENELVLLAVKGLQRGRTAAREAKPIKPVAEDLIAGIETFVSRQVWALIQLQLLTGARAGELVKLRGIDLKTGDVIWTVEPDQHKTAHLGHSKRIYFGPQAKLIIQACLHDRPLDACLFSPADAEAERRSKQHAASASSHLEFRITPEGVQRR